MEPAQLLAQRRGIGAQHLAGIVSAVGVAGGIEPGQRRPAERRKCRHGHMPGPLDLQHRRGAGRGQQGFGVRPVALSASKADRPGPALQEGQITDRCGQHVADPRFIAAQREQRGDIGLEPRLGRIVVQHHQPGSGQPAGRRSFLFGLVRLGHCDPGLSLRTGAFRAAPKSNSVVVQSPALRTRSGRSSRWLRSSVTAERTGERLLPNLSGVRPTKWRISRIRCDWS
jgi:hypothetical protein